MKNAAIYPITPKNQFLLTELDNQFDDLTITTAVVPNSFATQVSISNYDIFHKVEDVIGHVDTVIFVSSWDTRRMYMEIDMVLNRGIDVITTILFSDEDAEHLCQIAHLHNANFTMKTKTHIAKLLDERDEAYSQPESIVIAVSPITKGISSSKLITGLFASLERAGYKVGVICSDSDLQLLSGYEWLPLDLMINEQLDRCIMKINEFANLFQMIYKPDVIIVQMPDEGLYRMTYDFASCFGAKTFLVSQAINFDYGIVLSPVIDFDFSLYEQLSHISAKRFGFEYNSICLVPKIVNLDIAQGEEVVKYYTASDNELEATTEMLANQSTNDIHFLAAFEDYITPLTRQIIEYLS